MVSEGNVAAARNPFHSSRFLNCPRPGKSRLNKAANTGPFHRDFEGAGDSGVEPGVLVLGYRFNSVMSCSLHLPMPVKGQPGEDKQEPNRGAAWALEPDVESEGEGAGDEQTGDPGVAPATVGTRQIRFRLAHAKEGDDGEAVEDPAGEDEEIGQFFEGARERHQ